ncbi:TIGR03086 family metal-binding protein [Cryptosporangium arvum]|uniref:TIGR03086 family protein n=1 Tax=Cryptosporangium arvum DSM 44712 TaxID=927661 RepID=A0A010YHT9_9ACTN|nr:TIGR03086 family metal-binding protein [Cryptosporangium arvum]EXG79840.1 TIGR03086 family protein [Cryptosporangium arvum DSM 44712]
MHTLITQTVEPTRDVVRTIRDEQLGAPTPCREFDVKALVDHLLQWGPALVGAARKEEVGPVEPPKDWRKALDAHFDELVTGWGAPAAWEGTTRMGGPTEFPAPMIGGMVLAELVVHGWDLARATGQSPRWPEEVLRPLVAEARGMAEQGRQMGIFGPEVPVPADAPSLDRILGLTGRDPAWRP